MATIKLKYKDLKQCREAIEIMNVNAIHTLKDSRIVVDKDGVSTNAGTTDNHGIQYRNSLVISVLLFNALLMIADNWTSIDRECKDFIENNLEIITNFVEEK